MVENCKGCGEEMTSIRPALSRYKHGNICSDCGTREALEGDFISKIDPYMPQEVSPIEELTKDFVYKKGMEMVDEDGSLRYVVEDREDSAEIHLTGYDDFCMCESWYTEEEMIERFRYTHRIVNDLSKLTDEHIVECECEDEEPRIGIGFRVIDASTEEGQRILKEGELLEVSVESDDPLYGQRMSAKGVLTDEDIGQWFTYVDGTGEEERGKLKSYDNDRRVAWIVYKANGNWDGDHWKDYTAASTLYEDIKELQS